MNMSVKSDDMCTVLKNVRELLRDNVLPRLGQLEEEVRLLRKVTWPVCQSLRETSQLDQMREKREFLEDLDEDEIRELLRDKARVSQGRLAWSSSNILESVRHMSRTRSPKENSGTHPMERTRDESPMSVSTSQGL